MEWAGHNTQCRHSHFIASRNGRPVAEAASQPQNDRENLDLLVKAHVVVACLTALFASVFLFFILVGFDLIHHPSMPGGPLIAAGPPALPTGPSLAWVRSRSQPPSLGRKYIESGALFLFLGGTLAAMTAVAGNGIKTRRRYLYILLVAVLNCTTLSPLSVALGIFTFLVLRRPSVKALFLHPSGA